MTRFGLTFSDGNQSVCQTGYIFKTVRQAKRAARRFFDNGTVPVGGFDYFPGSGDAGELIAAMIEGDNYRDYGEEVR